MRRGLEELELSPHTIRLYMTQIDHAERWARAEGLDLRTIDADDFKLWVATRPRSQPTRRAMRSALRQYWEIVGRRNPPLWTIRVPRKTKLVCRAIDDPEAARHLERALTVGGKRGAAVVLALCNALRREEIATLERNVDEEGWIDFMGKGNKPATVPLHPLSRVMLDSLPLESSRYYFPGRIDGHVHPATIWNWIKDVTGDRPPHVLRHTALAKGNDETGDLRATQEFARHERPETTAGYTRATRRRMLMVLNSIDYGVAS